MTDADDWNQEVPDWERSLDQASATVQVAPGEQEVESQPRSKKAEKHARQREACRMGLFNSHVLTVEVQRHRGTGQTAPTPADDCAATHISAEAKGGRRVLPAPLQQLQE